MFNYYILACIRNNFQPQDLPLKELMFTVHGIPLYIGHAYVWGTKLCIQVQVAFDEVFCIQLST